MGSFHQKHFTADRACLVAVGGIEHNRLAKLGESLDLGKGAGKTFLILENFSVLFILGGGCLVICRRRKHCMLDHLSIYF